MSKIEQIEKEVRSLTAQELAVFRDWFAEFDARVWDAQIEQDAATGKLDGLAKQALKDHLNGKSSSL